MAGERTRPAVSRRRRLDERATVHGHDGHGAVSPRLFLFTAADRCRSLLRGLYGQSDGAGKGCGRPSQSGVSRSIDGIGARQNNHVCRGILDRIGLGPMCDRTLRAAAGINPIGAWINAQFTWMPPERCRAASGRRPAPFCRSLQRDPVHRQTRGRRPRKGDIIARIADGGDTMRRPVLRNLFLASGLLALTQLMTPTEADAEARLALVIGQSAYRTVPELPNAANDAKGMTELLGNAGFTVTTASNLAQNEMRAGDLGFRRQGQRQRRRHRRTGVLCRPRPPDRRRELSGAGRSRSQARGRHSAPGRAAERFAQHARRAADAGTHLHARCLPQQSVPGAQRRRPRACDRRHQGRCARLLHFLFDLARRGSRGRLRRRQPLHHGRADRRQAAQPADRGSVQAHPHRRGAIDRRAADPLGKLVADDRLQVLRRREQRRTARSSGRILHGTRQRHAQRRGLAQGFAGQGRQGRL